MKTLMACLFLLIPACRDGCGQRSVMTRQPPPAVQQWSGSSVPYSQPYHAPMLRDTSGSMLPYWMMMNGLNRASERHVYHHDMPSRTETYAAPESPPRPGRYSSHGISVSAPPTRSNHRSGHYSSHGSTKTHSPSRYSSGRSSGSRYSSGKNK